MTLDVLQQRPATSCGKVSRHDGSNSALVQMHKTSQRKHKSPNVGAYKKANDDIPERNEDDGGDTDDGNDARACSNSTSSASRESATARTLQLTTILGSEDARLSQQLLIASEKGNKHAVYLLLHQGVNVDRCRGMSGYSPLHYAATRGHLDVLQLLLDSGWPVDSTNDQLETPLHLAAYHGHVRAAECLLDRDADVNARNCDSETPLFFAARKGHDRVVRLLVRRECDVAAVNRFGDTADDDVTHDKTRFELRVGQADAERLVGHMDVVDPAANGLYVASEQRMSPSQRERIFAFLDLTSLCKASQVSVRWHRAADNPLLWRRLGVSRWELLLSATIGSGAIAAMGTSGIGGLRLNLKLSSTRTQRQSGCNTVSRRPASCDQSSSSSSSRCYEAAQSITRNCTAKRIGGTEQRPQTARLCSGGL